MEEALLDQPVPLLQRRLEMSREEAIRLWKERQRQGSRVSDPCR
jgi:hypothetical protein